MIDYDASVPDYVSSRVGRRITEIVAQGHINPRHPGCDFTAEVAAGAPLIEALTEFIIRRNAW